MVIVLAYCILSFLGILYFGDWIRTTPPDIVTVTHTPTFSGIRISFPPDLAVEIDRMATQMAREVMMPPSEAAGHAIDQIVRRAATEAPVFPERIFWEMRDAEMRRRMIGDTS